MSDRLLQALMARQEQLQAAGLNAPDIPQAAAYARGIGPGILGALMGLPGTVAGQVNTMFQRPPAEPANEQDYPAWEQARGALKQQQAEASFGLAGLPMAGSMPLAPRGALGSGGGRLPAIPPPETVKWAAINLDGKTYTGVTHTDAINTAAKQLGTTFDKIADKARSQDLDGFVTNTGRYVDRVEAGQIAEQASQLKTGRILTAAEDPSRPPGVVGLLADDLKEQHSGLDLLLKALKESK